MNLMSEFKMPKINMSSMIDKSILPTSAADFGIDTGAVNSKVNEVASKFDLKGSIDLSKYPNLKDKALAAIQSVPTFGHFSLMSFIPSSFFDQIDTNQMQNELNSKLAGLDLGEFGTLKLPDDIGGMAKDIISGKGIDFMSLYSMPAMEVPSYNLDSSFDLGEMTSEIDQLSSIAGDEFNMDEYLKEFSDINV